MERRNGKGSKHDFVTWCRICAASIAPDTKKTCIKRAAVRKGPCAEIFISKKMRFHEAVQNFLKNFFCVNLLITIIYYKYIDLYIM